MQLVSNLEGGTGVDDAPALMMHMLVFNIPHKAEVKQRQGHSLKFHLREWRSRGHRCQGLQSTPMVMMMRNS